MLRTGESFGAEHLIAILRGEPTDRVRTRGHHRLPTFGVGADRSRAEWQTIFRQLLGLDLIRPDPERHGALRLNDAARPILRGEASLTLRADTVRRAAATARSDRAPLTQVAEEDEGLLSALKAHRRALADAASVPAYVIFPDRTLIEMATRRPQTLDDFATLSGVGASKLERFGPSFVAVITGAPPPPVHPARRRLAGQPGATLFDQLHAAQVALARGPDGRDKHLSCTHRTLAQIAEERPGTLAALERIQGMGPLKTDRFGEAFLAIVRISAAS
jgi:ATP-dependent DNA helicase RecQ